MESRNCPNEDEEIKRREEEIKRLQESIEKNKKLKDSCGGSIHDAGGKIGEKKAVADGNAFSKKNVIKQFKFIGVLIVIEPNSKTLPSNLSNLVMLMFSLIIKKNHVSFKGS